MNRRPLDAIVLFVAMITTVTCLDAQAVIYKRP